MNEQIVTMGNDGRLVGVLTSGGEDPTAPVAVFFNAGLLHRVGPFRLWVTLARELARRNIASLRFDVSGHGDSGKPAGTSCEGEERVLSSLKEALDFVEARLGKREFVVIGLCSGADAAHPAACRDERIRGASMIDGYGYQTPQFERHARRQLILRRLRKSTSLANWRAMLRSRLAARPAASSSDALKSLVEREFPARERIESEILGLLAKGRKLHYVYTSGLPYFNHAEQFWEMFPRLQPGPNLSCRYFAHSDHTFSLQKDRGALLDGLASFVEGCRA